LRKFAGSDRFSATIASGLSVLGIPSVYFIHTAVQRWGGNHPEVVYRGGLLNDEMKLTFYMSISALILLGIVLFQVRYSIEKIQRKIDELYLFSGDIK
jgi:heme exporter protein C